MASRRSPVFVDDTGRRRALARRTGRVLVVGFAGYLGLLAAGFARNPHLGSLSLPTFGVSGIVRAPQPPATVLGDAQTRSAASESAAGADQTAGANDGSRRTGPASGGADDAGRAGVTGPATAVVQPGKRLSAPSAPSAPSGPAGSVGAPATTPATSPSTTTTTPGPTTTTTATNSGPGKSTSSSSTTTTTTTVTNGPGQGNGASSGHGPDGSGPPGQLRRTTTTTTSPQPLA